MKHGKKYQDSVKLIDHLNQYDPDQAAQLVVSTGKAKFDETVEVSIRLGVDPRHADQQVRGAVVLPHGTGRSIRVLVIAKGAKADEARAAGADYVGDQDMITKIQTENWFDFDVCVATPDMMGLVGRIGRVLGPKGLMPNPKSGTVTMDVTKAITEIKAGKVEYRLDKTAIIHCPVGKVSFGAQKIQENLTALMEAINKAKPAAAKGVYVRSLYMTVEFSLSDLTVLCPKMIWAYDKSTQKAHRQCCCENPCTSSRCGRMVYIYPEKDLRAYPGTIRGTEEWDDTYKIRTVVERDINHIKDNLCLAGRRTQNEKTLHADLILAGITQLITVVLTDKINHHEYIRSIKPLIA